MSPAPEPTPRRHDNDWLNVGAMVVIFFFHCAKYFDAYFFHVKNPEVSRAATLFVIFTAQWVMPLFFLLSGMSSRYSLRARSGGRYLANRFRRLFIPLAFGVVVVLVPVQVWVEQAARGTFKGSFWEFYPHYFDGFYAFGGNFAWMGFHLWYLEALFLFTLLTYPLFLLLKRERFQGFLAGAGTFFRNNGAVFLLAIPLFGVEMLVNLWPQGIGMRVFGGWPLPSYLLIFLYGYLMALDPGFREGMIRTRFLALGLGVVTASLILFVPSGQGPAGDGTPYAVVNWVRSVNSWSWLVAIVGFGGRYLDFETGFLGRAREAVLPFYILHQSVIVVVGYYLMTWQAGPGLKYLVLAGSSLAIILLIYELLVRRVKVLRFLFGMR